MNLKTGVINGKIKNDHLQAIAYIDCFSGISGDMLLGAVVALGVPVEYLKSQIVQLPLTGFDIQTRTIMRNGIQAVDVTVTADADHHCRDYHYIRSLIEASPLPADVKTHSLAVFDRIATAEAKIHGCSKEDVHFHEVGGVDAIVDIVGTCLGVHYLEIDQVVASPLLLGNGYVQCHHGVLPVPAPATLEILKDIPVSGTDVKQEIVTPTGAGLIATLAKVFGPLPAMRIQGVGYGAGKRELTSQPNLLRVIIGKAMHIPIANACDKLIMVETCIDDMNPELFGYLMDTLFDDGALDVFWIPVFMKKNRPGTMIQVLCTWEMHSVVVERILSETSSLGVRLHEVLRASLERSNIEVQTALGKVQVKKVQELDGRFRIVPEFEVCKKIAQQRQMPLRDVYDTIMRTAMAPDT